MFHYFFAYQDSLPSGTGFPTFGTVHLFWLAGIALALFIVCRIFLSLSDTHRLQVLNTVVLLALLCTFMQDAILTVTGHMNAKMLPFHLCDLAAFFYLVLQFHALRTGQWTSLAEITLCLFMPGAVLGILFPVWNSYPVWNYMCIHGFIYHALIILYPWLLFINGSIRPKVRHIWQPVLLLGILVPPVYLFNYKFGSNYMFLNDPPSNTPLDFLARHMGNPGYLIGYAGFIFLMVAGLYALFSYIVFFQTIHSKRYKIK